jgi:HEAT repeat protein
MYKFSTYACGTPLDLKKSEYTMKKLLLLGALLAAGAIGLQDVSTGHGGTYRGPGDTVPPGGGGGGGGGGPSTPGPSGPGAPGPAGPSTPGPSAPGAPGGGGPVAPSTQGGVSGPDLTLWQFWWGFNKDPYLDLKSHIHSSATLTGSDDFFLGHGQETSAKDSLAPSEDTIRNKIVPALLNALETSNNNDIVTGALIALAKIGDKPSEDGISKFQGVIEPFLKHSSQEIAETAAIALGLLGNPKSVIILTSLLEDDGDGRRKVGSEGGVDYRTRAFSAYGLGQIGSFLGDQPDEKQLKLDIVETLWRVCESPRMSTRDIKVGAVIAMGLVPLDIDPATVEAAGEGTEEEAPEGPTAPTTRGEQIDYLLEFFTADSDKNKSYLVRAHAPRAIVKLLEGVPDPDGALKSAIVEALKPHVAKRGKGEKELRQSASLAYGMIGDLDDDKADAQIRTSLIDACGNADQQVKRFSLIALGQIGGRPGTGEQAVDGEREIRKYLLQQLVKGRSIKPWAALAIGVMERGLTDSDREQSADALSALRSELEKSRTKTEVGAYSLGLGIAGNIEAELILLDKLDSMADDEVRGYITIGLGLMNSIQSIEPIQKILKDSKYRGDLLKQAAIALGLLGDKNVVTKLTTMLVTEAKTLSTQAAIASALGFIGDQRSVDPLIEMLKNEDHTGAARGFAAVALGIVADKETLPWNAKFSVNINYRANTTTLTGENGTGLLDIL